MQIASIKGQDVLLLYHPAEEEVEIGCQFVIEETESNEGILVQVINNESLEYAGLQQELIQQILEDRFSNERELPLNREYGMNEIRSLKIAQGKIRMRKSGDNYYTWDGWIPSRNAQITQVQVNELLNNLITRSSIEFTFCNIDRQDVYFAGHSLNMVNVITGVKGSGKSHFGKLLLNHISLAGVPCLVFDINCEYTVLEGSIENCFIYEWGSTYRPNLLDVGIEFLMATQESVYPLSTDNMKHEYESHIERFMIKRRAYLQRQGEPLFVSVNEIISEIDRLERNDTIHPMVAQGINRRLRVLEREHLFADNYSEAVDFNELYRTISNNGGIIVFDMHNLEPRMQRSLVHSILTYLEDICNRESGSEEGAYPFVFFEEAHQYIQERQIVNIITRGRHIGIASVFLTNTPDGLPEIVFRQLDNLFLFRLTHKSDIKHVAKSSLTDEETVNAIATRMPQYHGMIVGKITNNYPLVVNVNDFPEGWPRTGRTRSPWERLENATREQEED